MSVDRYFKGNFAIFYTDYNKRSINFIYDYAMWRASQENRNVIVFCTTPEKEEEWKKLISYYDLEACTICREASEGFVYLEEMDTNYIDSMHLQNIIIIDGAYDLFYGVQTLPFEPTERLRKIYHDVYCPSENIVITEEEWVRRRIKERAEEFSRTSDELLEIMDNCSENMIFLIAESEKEDDVCRESLERLYPGLIDHGDSVLGILTKSNYTDIIPFAQRGPHKWENLKEIQEDRKFAEDLHNSSEILWNLNHPNLIHL